MAELKSTELRDEKGGKHTDRDRHIHANEETKGLDEATWHVLVSTWGLVRTWQGEDREKNTFLLQYQQQRSKTTSPNNIEVLSWLVSCIYNVLKVKQGQSGDNS